MANFKRDLDWRDDGPDVVPDDGPDEPRPLVVFVVQRARQDEDPYGGWSFECGEAVLAFTTFERAEEFVSRYSRPDAPLGVVRVEVSSND